MFGVEIGFGRHGVHYGVLVCGLRQSLRMRIDLISLVGMSRGPGDRRRALLAVLVAGAIFLAGCTSPSTSPGDDSVDTNDSLPVIAATTSIWADVVSNLACGGTANVITVIPNGADPHVYEPSLSDRSQLESAVLIVANGLGFEAPLLDTISAVEDGGGRVVRIGDFVTSLDFAEVDSGGLVPGGSGSGGADASDHGIDPHVWFDPIRVVGALDHVAEQMVEAGLDRESVTICLADYRDRLIAADIEIARLIDLIPPERRLLITNHDALGYFADRYNLEVVGTVIPGSSTESESNPAHLARLEERIAEAGISSIFAETASSDDAAAALAERLLDVSVIPLYTEALSKPAVGADTYIGMLLTNARLISDALTNGTAE
jgi:zinc/manganese transport system substrate-binding protein